jgi:tetrahydromethanopterin S-methyltransferase subunit C
VCVHQLLGAWGLTACRRLSLVLKLGSGFGLGLGLAAVGVVGLGIGTVAGIAGLLGLSLDGA